ncbi:unnamed protein product [Discosporangium mesarthrocarpum]
MAERLTSLDIPSVAEATDAFGEDKGLLVCRPGRCPCVPFFTIPEGYYALVTKHGADIDYSGELQAVWPAGLHFGLPWLRVSNLITKQSVVFDMPVKGCKTQDNVTVQIDVAIIFRIIGDPEKGEDTNLVRTFIHQVGPLSLEQQLRGAQEEEVRSLARTMKHTEVYGLRSRSNGAMKKGALEAMEGEEEGGQTHQEVSLGICSAVLVGEYDIQDTRNALGAMEKGVMHCDRMKENLNNQFKAQGVEITYVIIKNVSLPTNIIEQMSGKTMVISSVAEQKMNQQSDMQQIVYNQEVDTLNQKHSEQREEESQRSDKECNEIQIRLGNLRAEAQKMQRRIDEDNAVSVRQIKADTSLQVSRLQNSQDAFVTDMNVKSDRQAEVLRAETELYVAQKSSEAALEVAKNGAMATAVIADAEGVIAPMVATRKEFETQKMRLLVSSTLAENPDLVISSSSNDDINAMLMCDAVLAKVKPGDALTRSQVLAELVMLQKGSRVYLGHESMEGHGA